MFAPDPKTTWHSVGHILGHTVLVYDRIDSTSTRCADFANDPANHGLVIVADSQTAGRGQHGRSWMSEPGMGLWLSVLLFPPTDLCRPAVLTAWAAVSVCRWLQTTAGIDAELKWPNDVLIAGQKICGILIEQNQAVVVGIGLNLNHSQESLQSAGLPGATSLFAVTGKTYATTESAQSFVAELDRTYQDICDNGLSGLETEWKTRFGLIGKEIVIEELEQTNSGRLLDMTFDAVVWENEEGHPELVMPEKIRHLYGTEGKAKNA